MSFSSAFRLDVQLQPGRPPMMPVDAAGDPAGRVADHRDALRALGRSPTRTRATCWSEWPTPFGSPITQPTIDGAVR